MVASLSVFVTNSEYLPNNKKLTFIRSFYCSIIFLLSFCVLSQAASAQNPKEEGSEPITAEDIAAGVEAVKAILQDDTEEEANTDQKAAKSDQSKIDIYCEISDLLDEAEETAKTDQKAANALEAQADKLTESLGEDFSDALEMLDELAEDSPLGKPLIAAFVELDKACDDDEGGSEKQ